MYNTGNEFLIESVEIDLLVTEGIADKSKKTFDLSSRKLKNLSVK